jgi:hypothetical protein
MFKQAVQVLDVIYNTALKTNTFCLYIITITEITINSLKPSSYFRYHQVQHSFSFSELFCLIIVGAEGYRCTCSHSEGSIIQQNIHDRQTSIPLVNNIVNNPNWCTIFFSMSFLYMLRTTMYPSSGETTPSMRHLVFVTLYG